MSTDYTLAYGTHATADDGRCAMEWVAHLAGEPHGDEPACVSPIVRALCIALNDGLDEQPRQRLRPYLTRTIGTADDGLDPARAWMAMDWLIRVYAPLWLSLGGLGDAAAALCAHAEVDGVPQLHQALPALELARSDARAARAYAFADAGGAGATRPATWASTVAAARAGREVAWACAGAAAWAAARLGIGDRAGDRARAAARTAAGEAAAIAVRRALPTDVRSRSAARAYARATLEPALAALTASAIGLLERMLPTEQLAIPAPAPDFAASV